MLIDAANPEEVRVCVLEKKRVEDFDFESSSRKPLRGNIYLARVTRVEPSLQAAFVEYGGNRHGFLAFSEIHPDYYQIPVSDRQAIQEAEAEEAALAAKLNLAARDEDDEDDHDDEDDDNADKSQNRKNGRRKSRRKDNEEVSEISEDDGNEDTDDEDTKIASDEQQSEKSNSESDNLDAETDDSVNVEEEEEEEEDASDTHSDSEENIDGNDDNVINKQEIDAENQNVTELSDNDEISDGNDITATSEDAEDNSSNDQVEEQEEDLDPNSHAALLEQFKEARRKRIKLIRNYKIQEVIKRRQILLIQVVKEERGNKGAALTTYMSLAGRYCVLMPNTARGGGISRKIPNASDRKRLRRVVDSLDVSNGMGLIIRTAGAKRTKAEIKRDYDYLTRLWQNIRDLTLKSVAPCIIYEEASLIKRAIRDLYDKDIEKVMVEGDAGYREAKDFMKMLMPSHAKNVQPYKEAAPLFLKHGVESQLDAMYQPTVRLKSGGYIVINQTEALIAIDVNSGKATRERNIERTALATNIEAAVETARQCRLRDLAGLLVIDFIDMEEHKNNRTVEKKFKEALKSDRARIQVGRISSFGLLEMSRQRRRSGIVDGTTQACPTCNGAGAVRSVEMAALRILRAAEAEAVTSRESILTVHTAHDVALYVLNHKRDWLKRIEEAYNLTIQILGDPKKSGDQYEIEKSGPAREIRKKATHISADLTGTDEDDAETEASTDAEITETNPASTEDEKPRKRRRRRKRKKSDHEENTSNVEADGAPNSSNEGPENTSRSEESDETNTDAEGDDDKPKRRRRRGRRGGRRNTRKQEGEELVNAEGQSQETADTTGSSDTPSSTESSFETPSANAPSTQSNDGTPASEVASNASVKKTRASNTDEIRSASAQDENTNSTPVPEEQTDDGAKVKRKSRKGWWQKAIGS